MFSFFRRKKPAEPAPSSSVPAAIPAASPAATPVAAVPEPAAAPGAAVSASAALAPAVAVAVAQAEQPSELAMPPAAEAPPMPARLPISEVKAPVFGGKAAAPEDVVQKTVASAAAGPEARAGWLQRLKTGLRKTGSGLATVFVGAQIDDALYEDLEAALLMADAGVPATEHLLVDLKRRVREQHATDAGQVKLLLQDALADMLAPLEKSLIVGEYHPTVIMVAGVNGAGKTTSIGKLTKHLADARATVLLAAADTFRAAAREQLAVWADRNQVEIISQQGADPSAVAFDAVAAGRARGKDVVLVDTAGRLPTQKHLMEELTKIRRVVTKADITAPHEVLLVIDGNTGQNALAQVKAFDDAIGLTGLIVTKLDGTAKGGVLAAIAREKPVPVYFVGVGESLQDLQTFKAREFAQALVG